MADLSDNEVEALLVLDRAGGSLITSKIPDRNERGVFGVEPGMGVYKRLVKKGLVFLTEEEPLDLGDGCHFEFTPSFCLTDEGSRIAREIK